VLCYDIFVIAHPLGRSVEKVEVRLNFGYIEEI
jgi:hypothetical protein